MKKINLKSINRDEKIKFLSQLQSGQYKLNLNNEQQPNLKFDILPNGLYTCNEITDELFSWEKIQALGKKYDFVFELVDRTDNPITGIELFNWSKSSDLENLLQKKVALYASHF